MFVDKYRPSEYKDYDGDPKTIASVRALVSCEPSPAFSNNVLFYGSPGTGKTTLANLLMTEVDAECLWTNASDDRGIEFVRGAISDFAKRTSVSFERRRRPKWVILDEADKLLPRAQLSIVALSDECRGVARILYLVNHISNMIEPLLSQCTSLRFAPLDPRTQVSKLRAIAAAETLVELDGDAVRDLARLSKGDMRRAINSLQIAASIARTERLPQTPPLTPPPPPPSSSSSPPPTAATTTATATTTRMAASPPPPRKRGESPGPAVSLTSDDVHGHLSEPTERLVTTVIATVRAEPFGAAVDRVRLLLADNGLSVASLLGRMLDRVLVDEVKTPDAADADTPLKLELVSRLADIELALAQNASERIQLTALIGAWKSAGL